MKMIPFSFEKHEVRAAEKDGELWFVAKDVCDALGIGNVSDAVSRLDDDEKGCVALTDRTPNGGNPNVLIVNESGMYALALRCRDAMTAGSVAHRFRKWVTADVLPTIRKTGGYGAGADPEEVARIATEAALRAATQMVNAMLPEMVRAQLARGMAIRLGKTAGEIWNNNNLPPLKNASLWLGNRLQEMGAGIEDDATGELGMTTARLFDPDKSAACMRNGLLDRARRYVAERKGQGVLKFTIVKPDANQPEAGA